MSDDEADPELLELLRQHLQGQPTVQKEPETGVLEGCEWIYDNCIDVALDMRASKQAAEMIYTKMTEKGYSTKTWSEHELHPKSKDEATVNFIFTMDLLNFSFWSDLEEEDERFAVEYNGKRWTGYWSLVASLQRALEEGWSLFAFSCEIMHILIDSCRHSHHRPNVLAKRRRVQPREDEVHLQVMHRGGDAHDKRAPGLFAGS